MSDTDFLRKKSPLPLDMNSMKNGVAFTSLAEAHSSVSSEYICEGDIRFVNLGFGIKRYIYKGGKALANLVLDINEPYLNTFNPLAYQRLQDTLYNVLDQYTGVPLTFKKTTKWWDNSNMDDTKADGIYYIKVGTEYFVESEYLSTGLTKPERFGADALGVADSTDAIRKSFAVGGKVEFSPRGNYKVSGSIYVKLPEVYVKGNGATITVANTYSGVAGAETFGFDGILKFFGNDYVHIENIIIDFPNFLGETTWQPKKICGITSAHPRKFLAENVSIYKSPCNGIYVEGEHGNSADYIKVINPTVDLFYRIGVFLGYAKHVEIVRPLIIGTGSDIPNSVNLTATNTYAGTMQEQGTGVGILIIHSGTVHVLGGEIAHALDSGIKCETSDNVIFDGLHVWDFGKDGIKVQGRGVNPQIQDVRVVNCLVHDKVRRRPDGSSCILVHDTDGAIVMGNIVYDNYGDPTASNPGTCEGIRLTNLTSGGINKKTIISNNVVKRLALGDNSILVVGEDTQPEILHRDLIISNNIVYNPIRINFIMGELFIHDNQIYNDIPTVTGADVQANSIQVDKCYKINIHDNYITALKLAIYVFSRNIEGFSVNIHDNHIENKDGHAINCITSSNNVNEGHCRIYNNKIKNSQTVSHLNRAITLNPFTFMDITDNVIEGFHTGIYATVGFESSIVRINRNVIRNSWSSAINLNVSSAFTPQPVTIELLEIMGNTFKHWNKNDTRPSSVAAKQNNTAISLDNGSLLTYNMVRVMENTMIIRNQTYPSTDANGVVTQVPTTQLGFAVGNRDIKYPRLYFRANTIDTGTLYSQENLRENCERIYGAMWTYNTTPGTIPVGEVYKRDMPIPALVSDNSIYWIVRYSLPMPEDVLITARLTTDNLLKVTYRNLGTTPAVIPDGGNTQVLLLSR